jgi:hypothetical protein
VRSLLIIAPALALGLIGCNNAPETVVAGSKPVVVKGPGPEPTATPEPKPADAAEVSKEINFPLMPNPAKPALALVRDYGKGEHRYEVSQIVSVSVAEVSKFYQTKLKLAPGGTGDNVTLMGEAPNGDMVMMAVTRKDDKTAVGAKIIHKTGPTTATIH